MSYTVLLLEAAIKDIEAIYRYIRKSGNKKAAGEQFKRKTVLICCVCLKAGKLIKAQSSKLIAQSELAGKMGSWEAGTRERSKANYSASSYKKRAVRSIYKF
jgi:hypothetical protein